MLPVFVDTCLRPYCGAGLTLLLRLLLGRKFHMVLLFLTPSSLLQLIVVAEALLLLLLLILLAL